MKTAIASVLLGLGSSAYAAIDQSCPKSGVCYEVNVPDSTASSGSGDIFFQITGPSSYAWIGMGTGSGMTGSNMFVIYQSGDGTNVTLSPRKGSGHNMPTFDSSAQAFLMEGSGVNGNVMTANIRCTSCSTSTSSWIYAANSQGPIKSDSTSESINQHDDYGSLGLSLSTGKGGADSNPFVSSGSGSNGSNGTAANPTVTQACTPASTAASSTASKGFLPPWMTGGSRPTGPPGPFQTSYSGFKRDTSNDCVTSSGSNLSNNGVNIQQRNNMMRMAHGILAGLAFAVFFPLGAISIRMFSFRGLLWFHAGIQMIANLMFIIAFGLGVSMAKSFGEMMDYHPVIGIILFVVALIQPVLGFLHHQGYNRTGGRTLPSHGHIWLGRILITLGMINGGLGFKLANNTRYGPIIYVVVAVIFFILYVVSIVLGERRRAKQLSMPPKYEESPRGSVGPTSPRGFYAPNNAYEMNSRGGGVRRI